MREQRPASAAPKAAQHYQAAASYAAYPNKKMYSAAAAVQPRSRKPPWVVPTKHDGGLREQLAQPVRPSQLNPATGLIDPDDPWSRAALRGARPPLQTSELQNELRRAEMERLHAHKKLAEELAWTQSLLNAAQHGGDHGELAEAKREAVRLQQHLASVELRTRAEAAHEIASLEAQHRSDLDAELAAAEDRKRAALGELRASMRLEFAEALDSASVAELRGSLASVAELRATLARAKAASASLDQQALARAHHRASKTAHRSAIVPLGVAAAAAPPERQAVPVSTREAELAAAAEARAATRVQSMARGRSARSSTRARSSRGKARPPPVQTVQAVQLQRVQPVPPPPPSLPPPLVALWRKATSSDGQDYYFQVDTATGRSTGEVRWDPPPPEQMWEVGDAGPPVEGRQSPAKAVLLPVPADASGAAGDEAPAGGRAVRFHSNFEDDEDVPASDADSQEQDSRSRLAG